LRIDLHVHTAYSEDCWVPLEALMNAVSRSQVDAIAVMDRTR